ncbi:alpha/beta hydrolase [Rhodocytophaga rosea]|uniref:Alpha/beta hydrolase n=1 Tax=Rhodocytophaga rosea TaxID=2704465 RepID=A0A6C0GTY5_9BACT|nr:alpha/beta hydrolase [Rhodocytophaga rosea]QHT71651.1 alpha/beta hydrolase [Rhodocytophaga rosea]
MNIKKTSYFKDKQRDIDYFKQWVTQLEQANGRTYESITIPTAIGNTHIWGLHTQDHSLETLVIFPGARTTALFWDLDKGLDNLNQKLRIFLVETNGLPNLSDGASPDIKSLDFGYWANEVLEKLGIEKAFIAGASFGGLVCMKLAIVHPEKIKAAFLLNPGCLQPFSLTFSNLYYNLLPIIKPTEKNVLKFLDKAVFAKPNHVLSAKAEKMLVDYEVFALRRYTDNTQKPYYMNHELAQVKAETYLLEGDKDLLFPFKKSISNAQKHIKRLKEVKVFENVGHGIETYPKAMNYIGDLIKSHQ